MLRRDEAVLSSSPQARTRTQTYRGLATLLRQNRGTSEAVPYIRDKPCTDREYKANPSSTSAGFQGQNKAADLQLLTATLPGGQRWQKGLCRISGTSRCARLESSRSWQLSQVRKSSQRKVQAPVLLPHVRKSTQTEKTCSASANNPQSTQLQT